MKNKKERIELSYNPQITVDHDSGIIVANDVTQDCTDHAQLEPQVNSTMENVGELPEGAKLSFDNGYFSGANLRYLETSGLEAYIPDRKQAGEMKGNKPKMSPFSKDSFYYDEEGYSAERASMSIKVSRCTPITVRSVANARSDWSALEKAK
jgi:hypothetical protein